MQTEVNPPATLKVPKAEPNLFEQEHLIESLYYLLHDAFRTTFGSDASPDSTTAEYWGEEVKAPTSIGVGLLLPQYKGWFCSPLINAPLPIRNSYSHETGSPRNRHQRQQLADVAGLDKINARILHRAVVHNVVRRKADILLHSIERTKREIRDLRLRLLDEEDSMEDTRSLIVIYGNNEDNQNSAIYSAEGQEQVRQAQENRRKIIHEIYLWNVRLHWLELWLQFANDQIKFLRGPTAAKVYKIYAVRAHADNITALIKTEDVYEAYFAISHFTGLGKTPNRNELELQEERAWSFYLLGIWYANILQGCGANWRILLSIRRRNPKATGDRHSYETWTTIAKNKYLRSVA